MRDNKDLKKRKIIAEKAKRAIEKEKDESLLASIAQNSPHLDVCEKAIEKLNDQSLLAITAQNTPYPIYIKAIEKLEEQSVLAYIAFDTERAWLCPYAIKKITDNIVLSEIAEKHPKKDARMAAIEKLTDQTVLARIIENTEDFHICKLATEQRIKFVKNLTDQLILANIAKNDNNSYVQEAALHKLTNQSLIADVAKCSDRYIGELAVSKLLDQSFLLDIAKNSQSAYVRCCALKKLYKDKKMQHSELYILVADIIKDIKNIGNEVDRMYAVDCFKKALNFQYNQDENYRSGYKSNKILGVQIISRWEEKKEAWAHGKIYNDIYYEDVFFFSNQSQ